MQIIKYPQDNIKLPPSAIALGFFDGVHVGHRRLINEMKRTAGESSLASAIFTFVSENDRLKPNAKRLFSTEERIEELSTLGVDYLILADFSAVSATSAEDFVRVDLHERLNCRVAVAGYNFRFGRFASGDAERLSELMRELSCEAIILPEERFMDGTLSTTVIREVLSRGECELAARMLGEPYHQSGIVEHGRGVGTGHGFPTINTEKRDTPLPRGVYATAVRVQNELFVGVTNLGTCPTFEEREEHLETMLLDFDRQIYGERVVIYFIAYLRGEVRFSSPEELKKQIDADAERARQIVRSKKWLETGQS